MGFFIELSFDVLKADNFIDTKKLITQLANQYGLEFSYNNHEIMGKKRKISFVVTKKDEKSYQICFLDPRPPYYWWFDLLFLTHHHCIKPKVERKNTVFGYIKK